MPDKPKPQNDPWEDAAKEWKANQGNASSSQATSTANNEDWKIWQQQPAESGGDEWHTQHPYLAAAADYGKGLLQGAGHTLSNLTSMASRLYNPDPEAMNEALGKIKDFSHPQNTAQKLGYGTEQAGEFLIPVGGEEKAGMMAAEKLPMLGKIAAPAGRVAAQALKAGAINKEQGGSFASGAAAGTGGGVLGEILPAAAAPLQERGIAKINRVIGATKNDFKRGANPGKGYFQSGMGPSLSLGSIANKAENALEDTGERIGEAIDGGASEYSKIPALSVARTISEPINNWHSVLSGPGGGSVEPVEDLAATFRPSLQQAAQRGGYTPRELFDVKKNVAKNVNWGDATQIGPKKVRQQITGAISDTLADYVPELRDLNSTYQNLTKLSERAADRASGRPSLSGVGKGLAKLGWAGASTLDKGVSGGLLGVIPYLYDSVPSQTGIASGLYYGGGALGRIAPAVGHLGPAAVLPLTRTVHEGNEETENDRTNKNAK
jgi:hypothetical protein